VTNSSKDYCDIIDMQNTKDETTKIKEEALTKAIVHIPKCILEWLSLYRSNIGSKLILGHQR